MTERKPQSQAPVCKKCQQAQTRVYRYKKIEGSKNGKWDAIGWACVPCRTMVFTQ
jgi:hypothetical protein